jgi:hypothetical protein
MLTTWWVIGVGALLLALAASAVFAIAKRRKGKRARACRDIYPLW